MPFGLDFKSLIVGALLAYFVLPRVMGLVLNAGNGSPSPRQ